MVFMEKMHPADKAATEYLEKERASYEKSKFPEKALVFFFLIFIFGVLILHIALPDKAYSKRENKSLSSFPDLSFSSLFEKEEGKGAEKSVIGDYLEDQFPFRDQFMALDAIRQLALTFGKSNGVTFTKDGYLLPEEVLFKEGTPLNYTLLLNTVKAYEESACYKGTYETVFALAGEKSRFVPALPFDYPVEILKKNKEKTDSLLKDSGMCALDLTKQLEAYKNEQLYYRTDHHWTVLGAYYASASVLKKYGKTLSPLSSFDRQTAIDNFRGTAYNASGMYFLSGEDLEFFRYEGDEQFTVSLCNPAGKVTATRKGFYDPAALEEGHMGTAYDAFVAGVNTPVVRITKEGEERPTLLVIKDSFAHSALPFLAMEFNLITVDLRAKNFSLPGMLAEGEIDGILVLVSEETLCS